MQFSTPVDIPVAPWSLAYTDRLLMLGSCFTDYMAGIMQRYFFNVTSNPLGTLYNPVSIARHIPDLIKDNTVVFITFGTAWVYIDKRLAVDNDLQAVVDNCQKRPASDFIRRRLSVDEIVALWQPLLRAYPDRRFVFTVSPIRHLKDGLHENQLSKSTLLLAVEQLTASEHNAIYFPSYEIMMDELRDYRFYAADMMHPSDTAIEYIWERFAHTFISSPSVQKEMQVLHQLWLDLHHRPLHPDTEETRTFQAQLRLRQDNLRRQYPWI